MTQTASQYYGAGTNYYSSTASYYGYGGGYYGARPYLGVFVYFNPTYQSYGFQPYFSGEQAAYLLYGGPPGSPGATLVPIGSYFGYGPNPYYNYYGPPSYYGYYGPLAHP